MIAIGRDLPNVDLVEMVRMLGRPSPSNIGDGARPTPRAGGRPSPSQRREGPTNAVPKTQLTGVENLVPLLLREPDMLGDPVLHVASLNRLTILERLQDGT